MVFIDLCDSLLQVIKRFIMHAKKTAFIVEHDFIMATYLADRVIVYDGQASINATAREPQTLLTGALPHPVACYFDARAEPLLTATPLAYAGMNSFLKNLDITFRQVIVTRL